MISFENTGVAFHSLSNKQLKKALWVFQLIGRPWIVLIGKILVHIALFLRIPIGWAIRGNVFDHFCGGENIEDCAGTMKVLGEHNIGAILDYSVEGKENEEDFDSTLGETLRTIEAAKHSDKIPFSVFKATGISRTSLLEKVQSSESLSPSERDEYKKIQTRVDKICHEASGANAPVFIDAEESWIQDPIDDMATAMMQKYNQDRVAVFNTIQLYRHDRLAYLKKSLAHAKEHGYILAVKLVRGAYMEKERDRAEDHGYPSPIQPDKKATDRDFNLALEFCLDNIDNIVVCAGTHNESSSKYLAKLMEDKGLAAGDSRIWFAQLYGMSDHISFNLSKAGYNVAKYVPYGPIREVIPYLIRRAEENTAMKGQTGRELSLIRKELERRTSTV
jgi:proline dehydrogenase